MPRLGLLAVAVAGALASFMYPDVRSENDSPRCRLADQGWEGVERLSHRLEAEKRVVVRHCRRWVDWRRWRHRVRATVTRDGETVSDQTIFEGVTTEDGVEVRFLSTGNPLQIRYNCGNLQPDTRAPHTCSRRWRWSTHRGELIVTSPQS
ncbi:MAG: hypothetical protein ABEN55_07640 [Bradymonadaceae bacterium]